VPPRARPRDRLPAVLAELREARHAHLRNPPAGRILTEALHAELAHDVADPGPRLKLVLEEPREPHAELVQAPCSEQVRPPDAQVVGAELLRGAVGGEESGIPEIRVLEQIVAE